MSSPSEHGTTLVVGPGEDAGIGDLIAAGGRPPNLLRLTGAPGDGRRLLAAIAASDQVICSWWPGNEHAADDHPTEAAAALNA